MQRANATKPNKKQSQRAAPRKQSKNKKSSSSPQGVYFQPRGQFPTVSSLPSSYGQTTIDPTWARMSGKVSHPEHGGGVRIVGRQLIASMVNVTGNNSLFAIGGSPATVTGALFRVSPDSFNGRLALQARTYDRYCFRKLVFTFVSRVPTTTPGSFAMGYVGDADILTPDFPGICSMSPSVNGSFITPLIRFTAIDDMTTTKTWFTMLETTTVADTRQSSQGTVYGASDAAAVESVGVGWLWADYMIDLYQPSLDEGFTLRLTKEEKTAIIAGRLREEEKMSKENKNLTSPENEINILQLRIAQLRMGSV